MKSSQFSLPLTSCAQYLHSPKCSFRVESPVASAQYGAPYEIKNSSIASSKITGVNFFSFVVNGSCINPEAFALKFGLFWKCIVVNNAFFSDLGVKVVR